jgi:predicted RND superfamily exporter protein
MNRAIRALAAVTLALVVFDVLLNGPRAAFVAGTINLAEQIARVMLSDSATLAGFATGIVTLVSAARHRHWRWLILLLPAIFLSAYGPTFGSLLLFLVAPRFVSFDPSDQLNIATIQFAVTLAPGVFTALVALAYALRGRPRDAVPDLEVSSIEEPDPVV